MRRDWGPLSSGSVARVLVSGCSGNAEPTWAINMG
ncbi:hypothetical protein I3843_11G035600 [Carya illinoinensis]|nr:hypothetical protein I3843_11G035600 [Carya illinoinensis]